MESTLDKLLKIQGAQEQQRIEQTQPPSAQRSNANPSCKIAPEERESWAIAYRLYEKYSPALRAAAALDDEGETACMLFSEIAAALPGLHGSSVAGEHLASMAFELLSRVYTDAKEKNQGSGS